MTRAFMVFAALAAAVWLCFVPSRLWSGRAEAADDGLTAEAEAKLRASLIVFAGKIDKIGPAPTASDKDPDAVQWVSYNPVLVLKGSWQESLVVEHVVRDHRNPSGPGLDPTLFAPGNWLVLGVELHRGTQATDYTLRNSKRVFGPEVKTDALVHDVLRFADPKLAAREDEERRRPVCLNNLSQLAQVYLLWVTEREPNAQKYSGAALWLNYRVSEKEIKRGSESVLLCPEDPAALFPKTDAEKQLFDDVDLSNPRPGLCSYAGRDFVRCPLPVRGEKPQPIGACLHHAGGAFVAYDDGTAKFVSLTDLGLASDAEKIVGPDSKSPLLRVLR